MMLPHPWTGKPLELARARAVVPDAPRRSPPLKTHARRRVRGARCGALSPPCVLLAAERAGPLGLAPVWPVLAGPPGVPLKRRGAFPLSPLPSSPCHVLLRARAAGGVAHAGRLPPAPP